LLPASVVPNVRATARQRRPVAITSSRPQEQQGVQEEAFVPFPPDEHFIQTASPAAPELEPVEVPLPDPQISQLETEEPATFSAEEQPAVEDQSQTITTVISKPKRPRQSTRSQKTTEDIQTPVEDIGNSAGTTQTADTLEKE
jgi:hypothetical protein